MLTSFLGGLIFQKIWGTFPELSEFLTLEETTSHYRYTKTVSIVNRSVMVVIIMMATIIRRSSKVQGHTL